MRPDRFHFRRDDVGERVISNASRLKLELFKADDGELSIWFEMAGHVDAEDVGERQAAAFLRDLLSEFEASGQKGGEL